MATTILERIFEVTIGNKKVTLADPNPAMSDKDVIAFYSMQYPELNNAILSNKKIEDDKIKYEYSSKFGTKG